MVHDVVDILHADGLIGVVRADEDRTGYGTAPHENLLATYISTTRAECQGMAQAR